ncbi:hypothetical protein DY000_02006604 [Brassica cretica]|uniref:Uncharacterized protein n=1 Tax=Brassica cretica TaxID=69181 RepID=A0ABQ7C1N1_BRACR|nr:hypothetical protein DY000_02006604 [Brassica cretica]
MNSDPRGLRTDGSRGDPKGCGIAQRYYQTSIVAGCDAPVQQKKDKLGDNLTKKLRSVINKEQ